MTKRITNSPPFAYELIPEGSVVVCALSGGADSMYLLHRLLEGAERYTLRAAHYDHGLRPGSGQDAQFVEAWCRRLGVPLRVERGDVAGEARRRGLGAEECARSMRYDFLQREVQRAGGGCIATGHHAGDNAETVLLHLVRGAGLRGLCGIPAQRGNIVRPMLDTSRQEILAWLEERGIPHREDESNADCRYARNLVRHQVLPLLEQLNPQAQAHIAAAARRLTQDEQVLEELGGQLAEQAVREGAGWGIPIQALLQAPPSLALRALSQLARRVGGNPQSRHLEGMLALCAGAGGGRLEAPGCVALAAYQRLTLLPARAEPPPEPAPLGEGSQVWGAWQIEARPAVCPGAAYRSPEEFYLKPGAYHLRSRMPGDGIQLGRRPRKRLKELMIEARIPAHLRPGVPVLAGEGGVAAVGGLGPHWEALAQPGQPSLHIRIHPTQE